MKVVAAIGLALILSMSGLAQTTATAVYQDGSALLDNAGNLLVVDAGRSTSGVTITGLRHSFFAPKTRLTIVPKGATSPSASVEYDGAIRVIGVGTSAIYAIATAYTVSGTTVTTTQSLIAIKSTLPAGPGLSGFTSFNLASSVEPRVGENDYISLITEPNRVPVSMSTTTTTTARTVTVLHFSGGSFDTVSSATLP
jgi:hypothetical protein